MKNKRIPASMKAVALSASGFAQSPSHFEVASIRPNNSGEERSSAALQPGGRFDLTNKPIQWLLRVTFGVQDFQIVGAPGWVAADRFERCGFQYHRETKELVVYFLVAEKNGPKLKEHEGTSSSTMNNESGPAKKALQATKTSMETLAINLSRLMNRTVIDKPGLRGDYDFNLKWAPDEATDSDMPSLFSALHQQLGLRLESQRGPVEFIVIDRIEKPSGN